MKKSARGKKEHNRTREATVSHLSDCIHLVSEQRDVRKLRAKRHGIHIELI